MFFVNEPVPQPSSEGVCYLGSPTSSPQVFSGLGEEVPSEFVLKFSSELDMPHQTSRAQPIEQYMEGSFLNLSSATSNPESGGGALVDTAAQRGLTGELTLQQYTDGSR